MTMKQMTDLSEIISVAVIQAAWVDGADGEASFMSLQRKTREIIAAAIQSAAFKGIEIGLNYQQIPN